jgi:hypothetical protein
MKVIIDAYKDSGHVLAEGFKVNGEKYTVLKVEEHSIYAKKVRFRFRSYPEENEVWADMQLLGQERHDHRQDSPSTPPRPSPRHRCNKQLCQHRREAG